MHSACVVRTRFILNNVLVGLDWGPPFGSAGLMPTEARGNYLHFHYLSQPATRVDTTCRQSFRPAINTAHFYFLLQKLSNYLTTNGLKKFLCTSGGPLRPEARGICHIWHMVKPALRH